MNLFRIVLKRTNKRKYNDSPCPDVIMLLLFVFLLPYVICCLWGHIGEESEVLFGQGGESEKEWIDESYEVEFSGKWGVKRLSMQEYLIQKLEMVMPREDEGGIEYEPEALKAQAVLLRTELWEAFSYSGEAGENCIVLQDDAFFNRTENPYMGDKEAPYREAVCETDGIYLSYGGKPVKAAYFPVSNGQTRNASEVMSNGDYPYLISVECSRDIFAKEYQSRCSIPKKEYCRLMREVFGTDSPDGELWEALTLDYDSTDYVAAVEWNGISCSGELFRDAFGLKSSAFRMEWEEENVTFYVKGVGHGLGMSQYGANERALSGDSFDKILKDYFFQAELVKIE